MINHCITTKKKSLKSGNLCFCRAKKSNFYFDYKLENSGSFGLLYFVQGNLVLQDCKITPLYLWFVLGFLLMLKKILVCSQEKEYVFFILCTFLKKTFNVKTFLGIKVAMKLFSDLKC